MTSPRDKQNPGFLEKVFHGRNIAPLAGPWIACIVIAGAVLYLETSLPVFHEVVQIIYFIIGVILIIATARWFRARGGNRRNKDRRLGDRRNSPDQDSMSIDTDLDSEKNEDPD